MKKFALVLSVFCLSAVNAFAADLPELPNKKAPAPVASAYDWSGFYFGVNAGYGWGSTNQALTVQPGGNYIVQSATLVNGVGTSGLKPTSGEVGGQFGYNYKLSPLLLIGVETDLDWNGLSKRSRVTTPYALGGYFGTIGATFTVNQRVSADWLWTARARLGVTPVDRVLVYATGGLAVANIRYTSAFSDSTIPGNTVCCGTEGITLSSTKAGWTLGAGIEAAVSANWSAKVEYLHTEFSGLSGSGSLTSGTGQTNVIYHSIGLLKMDTIRIGLNYRFGASPVVAKY